jgi:ATP-binding cassette subfamily B protein
MGNSRFRILLNYLAPHWKLITGGIIALLIVNALGVYIPLLIRDSIDDLHSTLSFEQVVRYALWMLVLASLMWVTRMLSRTTIFGVGRQVEYDLKQRIFQHLLKKKKSLV